MEEREGQEPKNQSLKTARRKAVDLAAAVSVRTEFLKGGSPLPLVVRPETENIDLAEWATRNRSFLEERLPRYGALLFRGFALDSVAGFERFASALPPELFGEYGDLPREGVSGHVYGSTPYPADQAILFHNESSHMHRWPMKIWFYCVEAAPMARFRAIPRLRTWPISSIPRDRQVSRRPSPCRTDRSETSSPGTVLICRSTSRPARCSSPRSVSTSPSRRSFPHGLEAALGGR